MRMTTCNRAGEQDEQQYRPDAESLRAFGRGDIETIIAALAPDVDWVVAGRREDYPLLGSWKGQSEVRKFFQTLQEQQEHIEFSPREFFAADDRVFVLGHYA